jgi:hypothetical protein
MEFPAAAHGVASALAPPNASHHETFVRRFGSKSIEAPYKKNESPLQKR